MTKNTQTHVHGTFEAQLVYRVGRVGHLTALSVFTLVEVPGERGHRVGAYLDGIRVGSVRARGDYAHMAARQLIGKGLRAITTHDLFNIGAVFSTGEGTATLLDLQYV